ncbi:MAG: enoyl-CoA hydratase [Rhodospirillaceae bacterium]|nr:enoyl-CoA hydratase [Rhodospirillaceae bacterium]|tara:strand:+ start:991 stop:1728 length:738 start_codon:yes stop_codon:yes gene_type:complete
MLEYIKTASNHGVVEVILNRPEKHNALSELLITNLTKVIRDISSSDKLRCVIVSGAGKGFSSGADIDELRNLNYKNAEIFIRHLHGACQAVRDCPVPVIAKVHGPCIGAGLELAVSCDLRCASYTSTFSMPEVQVGIPSVIEAALLPRLVGWGKASEILFTGKTFAAEEAMKFGLVEKLARPSELDSAIEEWIKSICSASSSAIRAQKSLMHQWEQLTINDAIESGVSYFKESYKTDELKTKLKV